MAEPETLPRHDFFVSYAGPDRAWAEWIAWQLEAAGFTTLLQAWDFAPGRDWAHLMQRGTMQSRRTIAVLSSAYLESAFGEAEWLAAFANDPTGEHGLLIPVRVEEVEPPGLLRTRVYLDLVGLSGDTARQRLLDAVSQSRLKPASEPEYPGFAGASGASPRYPGHGPEITNLPARSPVFVGRGTLLKGLYEQLQTHRIAIHGLGGVGKTELVLQYANLRADAYDVVWWIPASRTATAVASLAALAQRLRVRERADQSEMLAELMEALRRREHWLLVYDNAEAPEQVLPLLPQADTGHVLITSRNPAWSRVASPVELEVLRRQESILLLGKGTGDQDKASASAIAELLGDLPLALEEAAAYVEETRVGLAEYLQLARDRFDDLLGLGHPTGEEHRVATTWSVSLDRIRGEAPAAEALLELCAFLAPDDIPRDLPPRDSDRLPPLLAHAVNDPLAYNEAVRVLGRYSLMQVGRGALGVHPMVQAVVRARIPSAAAQRWAEVAVQLLRDRFPVQSWEVAAWPICQRLLPHVLAAVEHAERLGVAGEAAGWVLNRVAAYLEARGQPRQAQRVAQRALVITQAVLGPEDLAIGEQHDTLGRILRRLGDLDGARYQVQRALAVYEHAVGPWHADIATLRGTLAQVLLGLGELAEAEEELKKALEITTATLGPEHPKVVGIHNELARLLWANRDLVGAKLQLQQALAVTETNYGLNHPNVATIHSNLASVLQYEGDLEGARTEMQLALDIFLTLLGRDHPDVGTARSKLGRVLRELEDPEGAREQMTLALAILEEAYGPDHPDVTILSANLGSLLRELHDLDGAEELLAQALAQFEAGIRREHPNIAVLRRELQEVRREREAARLRPS
jgi:tetratricopeptide (TPR) repeat protein